MTQSRSVAPFALEPPGVGTALDDPAWAQWFYQLYQGLLQDGGVFPKFALQGTEGKITFDNSFMYQRLARFDGGLYSDYWSDNGNIIYGYAANVRRSAGKNLTVAAQLNAWGTRGITEGIFGIACTAVGLEGCSAPLIAFEPNTANFDPINTALKWGMNPIFKNRYDGDPTVDAGVSNNCYNYFSAAMAIQSQDRSTAGEFCGWARGIQFLKNWGDTQQAVAWNNSTLYLPGQVLTNGGLAWQCIQTHVNQVPAAISAYWVQHSFGGIVTGAIGIDFSSVDITTMLRMSGAIRLRDLMEFQWNVTGQIASFFDPAVGMLVIGSNNGVRWLEMDVATGLLYRNGVFLI